uniref:Keratinocyte associated protein 3 n=1 Tax=Callorhinchus milii TaxID=7868 RepID=V9LCG1_CALMI
MGICGFDKLKGGRQLMRVGIALICVGHINFILGAIVHGTILRHISKPQDKVTAEYSVANITSVISGLLSITAGIVAILTSRNLARERLHWGLMATSLLNALVSLTCCVGLVLAISITVSNGGTNLLSGCNSTLVPAQASRAALPNDCPFDTTRIYDTTLSMWFPSMFLSAVEGALSVRCLLVALILRGVGPCSHPYTRERLEEENAEREKRRSCELQTYRLLSKADTRV